MSRQPRDRSGRWSPKRPGPLLPLEPAREPPPWPGRDDSEPSGQAPADAEE